MKKTKSLIALIVSLILLVGACSPADTETTAQNAQTTTVALEPEEITTGATVESAEQTEALSREITYEAVYSGSWGRKGGDTDGFILINDRDELEKFVKLGEEFDEKYDREWFDTHALICVIMGHSGCDRAALNRIEIGERAVTIYIDVIHGADENLYEKKGKDYEVASFPEVGMHNESEGSTRFFIELDANAKEVINTLKGAILRYRDYPTAKWRGSVLKLWIEE